jgi:hypothetical protein
VVRPSFSKANTYALRKTTPIDSHRLRARVSKAVAAGSSQFTIKKWNTISMRIKCIRSIWLNRKPLQK